MSGLATKVSIDKLAKSAAEGAIDLGRGFSYKALSSVAPEDLREFVHEPVSAVPGVVCEAIAPVRIVLTPYLERSEHGEVPMAAPTAPAMEKRLRSAYLVDETASIFFGIRDENPSGYHQVFFNTLAHLLSQRVGQAAQSRYWELLADEIEHRVHGEVDEASWDRKQGLSLGADGSRPSTKTKSFREYASQSFTDTMTLYLHGICCDIDVEIGPRQMPSRWLRKRLEALYELYPPPNGRPVLPEHLARR